MSVEREKGVERGGEGWGGRPALSPEEWAAGATAPENVYEASVKAGAVSLKAVTDAGYASHRLSNRHGVAALALHGQPFGFTREDVENLRLTANEVEKEWEAVITAEELRSIAARIEALLPPPHHPDSPIS